MAEFCKIKADGTCMRAPNPLRIVVSNPSDERYRYEGWLEKKYTEKPTYDPEAQYITDRWVQDGQCALKLWAVHDIPVSETEETVEDYKAALQILGVETEDSV